jgi:DNA adenine methylase
VPADGAAVATWSVPAPFRWAGGKRWLLPILHDLLGYGKVRAYHEPFLGSGSVFLGLPPFDQAVLSDSNADLIEAFEVIREAPEEVAAAANANRNDEATYYRMRASVPLDRVERTARFLYLNHTSFNGIYRVNLDGIYNVPFGRRENYNIPGATHLSEVAARLKNAVLMTRDFAACIDQVQAGDLVFLDPPYTVAHNQNGFIKYNQRLFSFEDQRRLSHLIDDLKAVGAYYILTNAAHHSIAELFEKGDSRLETRRRNTIGGFNADRGAATEYLFTNLI